MSWLSDLLRTYFTSIDTSQPTPDAVLFNELQPIPFMAHGSGVDRFQPYPSIMVFVDGPPPHYYLV